MVDSKRSITYVCCDISINKKLNSQQQHSTTIVQSEGIRGEFAYFVNMNVLSRSLDVKSLSMLEFDLI